MSLRYIFNFKLKKFTSSFGFVAFFFLLLSTISLSHNFVVCNRYPFGLLVKFKLWNLTVFKISIVFQLLRGKLPMFVFVFVKTFTRISLAIELVPGPSGNTELAYYFGPFLPKHNLHLRNCKMSYLWTTCIPKIVLARYSKYF